MYSSWAEWLRANRGLKPDALPDTWCQLDDGQWNINADVLKNTLDAFEMDWDFHVKYRCELLFDNDGMWHRSMDHGTRTLWVRYMKGVISELFEPYVIEHLTRAISSDLDMAIQVGIHVILVWWLEVPLLTMNSRYSHQLIIR